MGKWILLLFIIFYKTEYTVGILTFPNENNSTSDVICRSDDSDLEIKYLFIYSDIRYRYARTKILWSLRNRQLEHVTAKLILKIPHDEFITEFIIEKYGILYKPELKIMDMDTAERLSNKFSPFNAFIRLVNTSNSSVESFDTYEVLLKLNRSEELNVTIIYEGLLQTLPGNNGHLQHKIHIKPEVECVESYEVSIIILESNLVTIKQSNLRGSSDKIIDTKLFWRELDDGSWEIIWKPNTDELRQLIEEGLLGIFEIHYDNPHIQSSSDVVMVRDGYLIYADDQDLRIGNSNYHRTFNTFKFINSVDETLPLHHVVFVLDVSGSMEGKRLAQLKLGMMGILEQINSTSNYKGNFNFVDIIIFSNVVQIWNPVNDLSFVHPFSDWMKIDAFNFISKLKASGSTNIFQALSEALRMAYRARSQNIDPSTLILFVTDGEATTGIINAREIRRRLKNLNPKSIPIHTLAFGSDADYELCRNISSDTNGGLARKIFDIDSEDAIFSFLNFYKLIVSNEFKNRSYEYTTPAHFSGTITHQTLVSVQYTKGKKVEGRRQKPKFHALSFDATTYDLPCGEFCLMERIFALRKLYKLRNLGRNITNFNNYCVRSQFSNRNKSFAYIHEANHIAMTHKFVTPCTSLVITPK